MTEDTRSSCSPYPPTGPDGWPVGFAPRWRTEAVVALARGIDAGGHHDRLPILADALEEAGCDRPEVLSHCRRCPAHHPRCWVINLVLDRPAELPAPHLDPQLLELLLQARRPLPPPPQPPTPSGGGRGLAPYLLVMVLIGVVRVMSGSGTRPPPIPPPTLPTTDFRALLEREYRIPTPPTGGRLMVDEPAPKKVDDRPLVIPPPSPPPK